MENTLFNLRIKFQYLMNTLKKQKSEKSGEEKPLKIILK